MECQQNFRQSSWGSEVGGAKNERYNMYICIYNAIGTNIEQIWLEHNFEYWIWYIFKKNVYSDGVMIICSFNICMCVKLPSLAYPRTECIMKTVYPLSLPNPLFLYKLHISMNLLLHIALDSSHIFLRISSFFFNYRGLIMLVYIHVIPYWPPKSNVAK